MNFLQLLDSAVEFGILLEGGRFYFGNVPGSSLSGMSACFMDKFLIIRSWLTFDKVVISLMCLTMSSRVASWVVIASLRSGHARFAACSDHFINQSVL